MKIFLFLFVLMASASKISAVSKEIDLYTSFSEKKADVGIGLHLKERMDVSAIYSQEFKDFEYNPESNKRYGFLLRVPKKNFFTDLTFYAGTLRYSGSYSRLKSPSLSAFSPISTLYFLSSGIKPALPSFSSSKQNESIAIKTPYFSAAYFENGTYAWSIQKTAKYCSAAISGAQHIYGRKLTKSWFLKDRYYREKKYSSYDAELCFSTGNILRSCNAIGLIENPFGGIEKSYFWASTQDSIKINFLSIRTQFFHSWTPLMILPSGKQAGIRNQFFFNPKITLHGNGNNFNAGFCAQKNERTETSKNNSEYDEYTFKSEASLSRSNLKLDFQYTYMYSTKTEQDSYKTLLYLAYKTDNATFKTSAGTYFKGDSTTLTLSQSIALRKGILSSIKISDSIAYRKGQYDNSKISGTATFSFRINDTKWQGKISLASSF